MNKRTRIISGLVLAAAALGLFLYTYFNYNADEINGIYELELCSGEAEAVYRITFHKETMIYILEVDAEGQTFTFDSGTYSVEADGAVRTYSEVDDANSQRYVADGEYVVAEGTLYEGEIPPGDTFEAECASVAGKQKKIISFHEDGTYEEESYFESLIIEGEKKAEKVEKGTYERNGNFIRFSGKEKDLVPEFYIYQNRITKSYYKKVK